MASFKFTNVLTLWSGKSTSESLSSGCACTNPKWYMYKGYTSLQLVNSTRLGTTQGDDFNEILCSHKMECYVTIQKIKAASSASIGRSPGYIFKRRK